MSSIIVGWKRKERIPKMNGELELNTDALSGIPSS
jgi:hypothetical protein